MDSQLSDKPEKVYRKGVKKSNFTKSQAAILKKWFIEHANNPYLKEDSKKFLAAQTGLQERQVANWFTNVRKRIWQPIKKNNRGQGKCTRLGS